MPLNRRQATLSPLPAGIAAGELPTLEALVSPALSSSRPLLGLSFDLIKAVVQHAITRHAEVTRAEAGSTTSSSAARIRTGGEDAAVWRLNHFLGSGLVGEADRSAAGVGEDGSSKLSSPLALGTLSPRLVHATAIAATTLNARSDPSSRVYDQIT